MTATARVFAALLALGPAALPASAQGVRVNGGGKIRVNGAGHVAVNAGYLQVGGGSGGMSLLDDFSDGDYTANPAWTSQGTSNWVVAAGEVKSGDGPIADNRLSTPSSQAYGTWEFKYHFEIATTNNILRFFLIQSADTADPAAGTADGYYVWIDGGLGANRLRLRRLNNGAPTDLILADWTPGTGVHTIKVTRSSANLFELFYDAGSKGTATDATYTTSSYVGLWATSGASLNDNFYYDDIYIPGAGGVDLTANTSQLTVAGNLTINSGSEVTVTGAAAASIRVGGNWSDAGAFTPGSSTVTFDGAGVQTIDRIVGGVSANQTEAFYHVRIEKPGGTLTTAVSGEGGDEGDRIQATGNLNLVSGIWDLDPTTAQIPHVVQGAFTQSGGTLKIDTSGTVGQLSVSGKDTAHLRVQGDVALDGGSYSGALTTGIVEAWGNLSESAGYKFHGVLRARGPSPGPGTSTVTVTAAGRIRLLQVWGNNTSNLIQPAGANALVVERVELTRGTLQVPAGTLLSVEDVPDAGFTTAEADRLVRFTTDSTAASGLTISGGAVTAPRFQNHLSVGSGARTFEISSGTLTLGASGDGCYGFIPAAGGTVTHTLSGGTINVAGDWGVHSAHTFNATTGSVKFNGSASQTITHSAAGGFYNVELANTAADDDANPVATGSSFSIGGTLTFTDGRLRINGGNTVTLSAGTTISSGTALEIRGTTADGALRLPGGSTLTVNGLLRAQRPTYGDTGKAITQINGAGTYTILVPSGGSLWASDFEFRDLASLEVRSGARVIELNYGKLHSTSSSANLLDLRPATSPPTGADRWNLPFAFDGLTFDAPANTVTVRAGRMTPFVAFLGATGAGGLGSPSATEQDPFGQVQWWDGLFERTSGTPATYNTLRLALASVTNGVTNTVRVKTMVPLSETHDAASYLGSVVDAGENVILENAAWYLPPAVTGTGTLDYRYATDDASAPGTKRWVLRNAVVARGGIRHASVENGTLYRASSAFTEGAGLGLIDIASPGTLSNLIQEGGSDGLAGSVLTLTPATADAGYFVSRSHVDYHLRSGAALAINQGVALTLASDMDGVARPQGAAWDIGAYERFEAVAGNFEGTPEGLNATNLGAVTAMAAVSKRKNGAGFDYNVGYVVTAGGSTAADRDTHLVAMNMAAGMEELAVFDAGKPIVGMYAFAVDLGLASYETRIWLYLDTDYDGYADGMMAVIDTGGQGTGYAWNVGNLAAGYATPQTSANAGSWYVADSLYADWSFAGAGSPDGIRYFPAGAKFLAQSLGYGPDGETIPSPTTRDNRVRRIRLTGASWVAQGAGYPMAAAPGTFDVTPAGGQGVLMQLNVDPTDYTANANASYGTRVWANTTYNWEYRGSSVSIIGTTNAFYPITQDFTPAQIMAKVSWSQNGVPTALLIWDAYDPIGGNGDENAFGMVTTIYTNDGKMVFGYTDIPRLTAIDPKATLSNETLWTTNALSGTPGRNTTRPAVRLGGTGVVAGIGNTLQMVKFDNPSGGTTVAGAPDWPVVNQGTILCLWVRDNFVAYGTDAGECVIATHEWQYGWGGTSPSFTKLPGFPYRVPGQRITGVVGYTRPTGKWSFLFRTNRGLVFRFDRP